VRATLVYRGSRAVATRADLGPLTPAASVVDWWTLRAGPRDAVHLTVKPSGRAYAYRVLGSLWTAQGVPVPDVSACAYRLIHACELDTAREIARHLARQYAEGLLPAWPTSPVDRIVWQAALAIGEVFCERFGTLDTALREVGR
jgi:hypothetical protein